ncbi:MAG: 50S ribosomal protein L17, partial [Phototrophicales bacterium]
TATAGTPVKPKSVPRTPVGKSDDLTRVEGIGPKMAQALIDAGINTYAKLAEANEDTLRDAIQKAGMRLAPSIPTWAEQAAFARDGKWDELEKLQESLEGGRRV